MSRDKGPRDYVVAGVRYEHVARELAQAINRLGDYSVDVQAKAGGVWQVVLPGQCIPGTELYMRGFLDAFTSLGYASARENKAEDT